jgi:hypothetical protein
MNFWSALHFAFAVSLLCSCAADDTIVAVNVNATDQVGNPSAIVITITQAGQTPVNRELAPPTRPIDGGTAIRQMFFERVTLPESWESGPAKVRVEARNGASVSVTSEEVEIEIRDEGAVAAYVDLGEEPEPMPEPDAGTGEDAGR